MNIKSPPLTTALMWFFLATNSAFGKPPPESKPATANGPCGASFVIYAPGSTRRLLWTDALNQAARVNRWRDLLRERGAQYRILTNTDQWKTVIGKTHIILPSAYMLSDLERSIIDERLRDACGLLTTGMPASQEESGASTDLAWAQSLFGPMNAPHPVQQKGEFVILAGDTPLTHGLPPGTRLWVGKAASEIRPGFQRANAAYVSDWSATDNQGGALLFSDNGQGRRAYLGWPESVWNDQPSEFRTIARQSLDWIQGRPTAYLGHWPWPYRAAMTLGINAAGDFEKIAPAVEVLGQYKSIVTFNVLASDLDKQGGAASVLMGSQHELAVLGDRWESFSGQSSSVQALRVESAAQTLRRFAGSPKAFEGMRTPEGITDEATELAVVKSGGRYLVDTGRIDSLLPVTAQSMRLTVLPNSLSLDGGAALDDARARDWGKALISHQMRVENSGGYTYVGLDVNALTKGSASSHLIETFLSKIRTSKILWLDSAAHIAQWWQERQRIEMRVEHMDDGLKLAITVQPGATLQYPVAVVLVPPMACAKSILSTQLGAVRMEQDHEGLQILVLEKLTEGAHTVTVRFE